MDKGRKKNLWIVLRQKGRPTLELLCPPWERKITLSIVWMEMAVVLEAGDTALLATTLSSFRASDEARILFCLFYIS